VYRELAGVVQKLSPLLDHLTIEQLKQPVESGEGVDRGLERALRDG
jgi:hypothetical protein